MGVLGRLLERSYASPPQVQNSRTDWEVEDGWCKPIIYHAGLTPILFYQGREIELKEGFDWVVKIHNGEPFVDTRQPDATSKPRYVKALLAKKKARESLGKHFARGPGCCCTLHLAHAAFKSTDSYSPLNELNPDKTVF